MHPEAFDGFGHMLSQTTLDPEGYWQILDIGGQHINGNVHSYFPNATIKTLDLENADIIADACTWVPDQKYDVVICTEVFEHVRDWPQIIATAHMALDGEPGGYLLATWASDNRPPHGATGAPLPEDDEWYANVPPKDVDGMLASLFTEHHVEYRYPPGDGYAWARR